MNIDGIDKNDIEELLEDIMSAPNKIIGIMAREGLRLDNLEDPMQKLAMTMYSSLVVLSVRTQEFIREAEERSINTRTLT